MVNTTKRSKIWNSSRDDFQELCSKNESLAAILRSLDLHAGAGNYKTLKRRIDAERIDISHIHLGLNSNKFKYRGGSKPKSLEDVAVENSSYDRGCLKKQILKQNLIEYKCTNCTLTNIWNGKPLVLRLDHINGISNDNRLSNLRFICPNCDSQLSTFSGRNNALKHK